MHDFLSRDMTRRWSGEAAGMRRIAEDVLNSLADRTRNAVDDVDAGLLSRLIAAALDAGDEALEALHADMRRARIAPEAIVDRYIPAAARLLGEDWVTDRKGFASVTIATARLQAVVREIGAAWSADQGRPGGSQTVLVAVPDIEDHTLGAVVLTSQLRRMGWSVCLCLKEPALEIKRIAAARGFDAAFISFANVEKLGYLRTLAASLRGLRGPSMPIVVGGAVVGRLADPLAETGADMVTSEAAEAARQISQGQTATRV